MKNIPPSRGLLALILIVAVATVAATQFAPTTALAKRQVESREQPRNSDSRFDQDEDEDDGDDGEWIGQLAVYRELLGLIQQFHAIAKNKSMAGVSAVMGAEDHFEDPEEVVTFLERMLKQTNDKTIQRAIRITLIDKYESVDRPEDAQAQLEALILQ